MAQSLIEKELREKRVRRADVAKQIASKQRELAELDTVISTLEAGLPKAEETQPEAKAADVAAGK